MAKAKTNGNKKKEEIDLDPISRHDQRFSTLHHNGVTEDRVQPHVLERKKEMMMMMKKKKKKREKVAKLKDMSQEVTTHTLARKRKRKESPTATELRVSPPGLKQDFTGPYVPLSATSNAWQWWRALDSPRYILSPMVGQSELPFRLLCRRYGARLGYTPMLISSSFISDPHYRQRVWQTCPEDQPLIAQFCGNNPQTLLAAAKLVQDHVNAIDLNLGCPQVQPFKRIEGKKNSK